MKTLPAICGSLLLAALGAWNDRAELAPQQRREPTPPSLDGKWRSPSGAPVTALFLMLQGHGVQCTYEQVVERLWSEEAVSLHDIVRVGEELGGELVAVQARPEDLAGISPPVLLHMEPITQDFTNGGRLALLTHVDEEQRRLVAYDAATGVRGDIAFDDFAMAWSGAAVTVRPDTTRRSVLLAAAAVLGIGGLAHLVRRRRAAAAEGRT